MDNDIRASLVVPKSSKAFLTFISWGSLAMACTLWHFCAGMEDGTLQGAMPLATLGAWTCFGSRQDLFLGLRRS